MDVAAILVVRDGGAYAANCLTHLKRHGIHYAVIDHASGDGLPEIVRDPRLRSHLLQYARLPWNGSFELVRQLEAKEALAQSLSLDWIIHHDIDEVMHPYLSEQTLLDVVTAADAAGANAINLDEFVFLPVDCDYVSDHPGWQPMRHYYSFEEQPNNQLRVRRADAGFSLVATGGHRIERADVRVADSTLALRHYMFRSQQHAYVKYATRRYTASELQMGWHHDRAAQPSSAFRFPPRSTLRRLATPDQLALDRANPRREHYWQWPSS